jgi:PEGA domain
MRWASVLPLSLILSMSLTGCASVFGSHEKQFDLSSQPADAEVFLDGNRLGTTPVKVKLSNHQSHTFTFRKAGYKDATCSLVKTTGAGWVILDILGGLIPVVIDAATNNWSQTQGKGCAGYMEPVAGEAPSTAAPTQEVATPRSATPLRDQIPSTPAAPDSSYKALWKNIPPSAHYVADTRHQKYFPVSCGAAVAVPEEARMYYQTEGAAQADGYTLGDC